MTTTTEIHPVDQILPTPRLLALGLQHVLVMYAGAVAVPLIIGRALKLPPEDVAFLISADLFACGIATLVQCIGFPGVGIRLPVMMGVTFASVGPMLSMAAAPDIGLLGIYGSVIAAGLFRHVVAPFVSRLLPLFPPVVTGTIILVIGISLMRVGINWARVGGLPTRRPAGRSTAVLGGAVPQSAATGQLQGLGIALFVLLVILAPDQMGLQGFVANVAVLLGIVAGGVLAAALGMMHFEKVAAAPWFAWCMPFHFGMPKFQLGADRHHVHRDDRGDDRIDSACFWRSAKSPARQSTSDAVDRACGPTALGTMHRRHVQHLPLHVVLAERRPGRRHRRALALGHRRRRRHHAGARADAEDGGAGRGACRWWCSAAPAS